MKIIEKVLKENPDMEKRKLLMFNCPSDFGHGDIENCEIRNQGTGKCKECWNQEIKEA